MIPFPIINFGAGPIIPAGVKIKNILHNVSGGIYLLLTNGDLYVVGNQGGNGLGKNGTANILPSGWTLTNTGVEEVYPASITYGSGVWVKKNNNLYEYTSSSVFPAVATELNNSWNVLPASYYTIGGINILSSAIQITKNYAIQPDGTVYQFKAAGPEVAWPEKTKYIFENTFNQVRVDIDGSLKYNGPNGYDRIDGTVSGATTTLSWKTIGDSSIRYVKAKCSRGQIRDPSGGTGAVPIVAVFAQREDGVWEGCGSTGRAGSSLGNLQGPTLGVMTDVPTGSDLYTGQVSSYREASLGVRTALQTYIVDRVTNTYLSSGGQGGETYSLYRNLPIATNSTTYASMDQQIIDDGGVLTIAEGFGDTFGLLATNNGGLYWVGKGYSGANWPSDFNNTSTYLSKFNLEGIVIPE
jgi:hypothetical protein